MEMTVLSALAFPIYVCMTICFIDIIEWDIEAEPDFNAANALFSLLIWFLFGLPATFLGSYLA
jgi:hypothetical protein